MKMVNIEFTEPEVDDMIALLDGCLGTSEDDDFNRIFGRIKKKFVKNQIKGVAHNKSFKNKIR